MLLTIPIKLSCWARKINSEESIPQCFSLSSLEKQKNELLDNVNLHFLTPTGHLPWCYVRVCLVSDCLPWPDICSLSLQFCKVPCLWSSSWCVQYFASDYEWYILSMHCWVTSRGYTGTARATHSRLNGHVMVQSCQSWPLMNRFKPIILPKCINHALKANKASN